MCGRCSGGMRSGEERTERVRSGAFSCRRERAVREVRRRAKIEGRGRWERMRDWISEGRSKKRAPRRLVLLALLVQRECGRRTCSEGSCSW